MRTLTTLLFLLFFVSMDAQEPVHPAIIAEDTLTGKNGQWVMTRIGLYNPENIPLTGKLYLRTPEHISPLGDSVFHTEISAATTLYHPVRLYIHEPQPAGTTSVTLILKSEKEEIISEKDIYIKIPLQRRVRVFSDHSNIDMENAGDELQYRATVRNDGNVREKLKVVFRYPGPAHIHQSQIHELTLPPFSDTIMIMTQKVTKELLSREQFYVNIAVLDPDNSLKANTMIIVNNLSSNRRYIDPESLRHTEDLWQQNQIKVGVRDIGRSSEALILQSRGNVGLPSGRMIFNVDYTHWFKDFIDPILVNSWAEYEKNNKGISAGTIIDTEFDIPVNGRGVKGFSRNESREEVISFGFSEKSYNLLQDWSPENHGFSLFAKAKEIRTGRGKWSSYLLHDRGQDDLRSNLWKNKYSWFSKKKWFFELEQSAGYSRYDQGEYIQTEPALALGYTTSGTWRDLLIYSRSYWSNAYYPGLQRGSLIMNHSVRKRVNQHQFWINTNLYNREPEYMNLHSYLNADQSRFQGDLGWNSRISRQIRFSLSPIYRRESGHFLISWDEGNEYFQADHLLLNKSLYFNTKENQHHFVFSTENGTAKYSYSTDPAFYHRSGLQWNHRFLNMNIHYQKGSRYLSEAVYNEYRNDLTRQESWVFSTGYHQNFVQNRLQTQLQFVYQKSNVLGENWNLASFIRWKMNDLTEVSGSLTSYHYKEPAYFQPMWIATVALAVNLPNGQGGSDQPRGNINIFAFYDQNGNGIFDEGDEVAEDRVIRVNRTSFIADKEGKVQYKKVPFGKYALEVEGVNWYTPIREFHHQHTRTQVDVPLQATGILRGKFVVPPSSIKSSSYGGNLAGITIEAVDPHGKKWTGRTNAAGNFTIQLPVSTYHLSVVSSSLPENITMDGNLDEVTIRKRETTRHPDISLEVKTKEMKVKRFGFD